MLTKILLGIAVLLAIAFLILVAVSIKNDNEVSKIWQKLADLPTENIFTEDMVAGLPNPVQRYFFHAIAPGTLVTDTDGKPLKLSLLRWGDKAEDGSWHYIPLGVEFQAEQKFGGFTIPSQMNAGWWFGTERYLEFFRATIAKAEF
jgi:hypothetical protein